MFLDKILNNKKQDDRGTKQAIQHDKWDLGDWNKIVQEMKELSVADDKLAEFTATGHEAMTDTFFSLYKALPHLEDANKIRPSHIVNRHVMGEAMELPDYVELRSYSSLDLVASAMACVAMEPELEILFDKLKEEQEKAQQLDQMLQQMEQMQGEGQSIDEMIEQALADGDEEQAANYQEQAAQIAEALETLRQQMEQGKQQLQEQLESKSGEITQAMSVAMGQAKDQAETIDSLSNSWGLDPGSIKKMPADKRIELAKRINNEKFKKLAQVIGPMQRLAMSEQTKKLEYARDEIYDLELGSDLQHVLPEEMLFLGEDDIELIFFKKFYEDTLMQFKLQGTDKIAKGGIIYCEDGSGSMHGTREIWAKAVGLALLQIARSQNRDFMGIHFCGPGVYKIWEFNSATKKVSSRDYRGYNLEFNELDGILDYAETSMGGGTDFVTPLSQAIDKLDQEYRKSGKIKGDIVFATDGECGVPGIFLDKLAEEKERLGFRIFGIAIDCSPNAEPLKTICDGRVWSVKDIISGKDISTIFRDL